MVRLTPRDKREIERLRASFSQEVAVHVLRSTDGGLVAELRGVPGCRTEADTFSELIEMVNDAILTYLEIPKQYAPFMPAYVPPMSEAERLNLFPVRRLAEDVKLKLAVRGATTNQTR